MNQIESHRYEVTNESIDLTREYSYYGLRVITNSNSAEKAAATAKTIAGIGLNESVELTDNYGAMGGGKIIVKRIK